MKGSHRITLMLRVSLWLLAFAVAVCVVPAFAHDTVYYYYTDAIHSAVVETDAQGNVIERTYYAPYGQVLNRDMRDGPGYTGHEEDPATGLVYMQQRYYDPQAGRFLSVDPVAVNPTTGANFNRYWYAKDNPYRYTDPDGRCAGAADTCASMVQYFGANPVSPQTALAAASALPGVGDAVNIGVAIKEPSFSNFAIAAVGLVVPEVGAIGKLAKVAKEAKVAAKGAEAAAERAKNIAKGIPESHLGPSGKPKVYTVEHSTRKGAREAANSEAPTGGSTRFDAHSQDGQKPHFQAEDASGKNVKPVVHHCVPSKSC